MMKREIGMNAMQSSRIVILGSENRKPSIRTSRSTTR
jgi:hypothetical protein